MMDRGESSLLRIIKKEYLSVFRLRLIFELILSIEGFILFFQEFNNYQNNIK